jgi:hypothetical protein
LNGKLFDTQNLNLNGFRYTHFVQSITAETCR